MKKVLWISRHCMTKEQIDDLKRIIGEEIDIIPWKETLHNVSEIKPLIEEADLIAAVLPLGLLAELLKISGGKMVLQSVSARIPSGKLRTVMGGMVEPEFEFHHKYWEQIKKINVEVKRL